MGSGDKWEKARALMERREEQQELELGMTDVEGGEQGCEVG